MGLGGGGVSAGSANLGFPTYMETMHDDWLTEVDGLINDLQPGASPFNDAFAYDPSTNIQDMEEKIEDFQTDIDDTDPEDDFDTYFQNAAAEVDANMLSDSYITTARTAAEASRKPGYYRSVNSFTASMNDLNAVHNTGFIIGLAMLERGFNAELDQFEGQMRLRRDSTRFAAILQATGFMIQLHTTKLQARGQMATLQIDEGRTAIIAQSEEVQTNTQYDAADLMWDFDLYDRGGRVLGAIVGAPVAPRSTGLLPSILGGVLSGGSLGAQALGGIGGSEGALLGLLLGGGFGGFGGLIG